MANIETLRAWIDSSDATARFKTLYPDRHEEARRRYHEALDRFCDLYGNKHEAAFFSVPGRTELGGNHTDHNGGTVLCGSIDLDVISVAAPSADNFLSLQSEGHGLISLDLSDCEKKENEVGTSAALCRGVAAHLKKNNKKIGGFMAYTHSIVPSGAGVSSSAAFEIMIGTIFNHLYNNAELTPTQLAEAGQFAESEYYGKPCGMMDQMACAHGGTILIDFSQKIPLVTAVKNYFDSAAHILCLVKLDVDHDDLTEAYAAIPAKMRTVAKEFEKDRLCEVEREVFYAAVPSLRKKIGDLPVLAALHFYQECERAERMGDALRDNRFPSYLALVCDSGASSFQFLQNVLIPGNSANQGAALALNLASQLLCGSGAWRIHGGGFGGTTQNYVPKPLFQRFCEEIEAVFGKGSVIPIHIRNVGAAKISPEK